MKKRLMYLALPVLTLILEILPYGAVCNFANPEGEAWRRTYSYFDLTPFGYANFAPLLTALLTCLIIVLTVIFVIKGKTSVATAAKYILLAATVISLGPLLLGREYFSVIGSFITAALAAQLLLLSKLQKTDRRYSRIRK